MQIKAAMIARRRDVLSVGIGAAVGSACLLSASARANASDPSGTPIISDDTNPHRRWAAQKLRGLLNLFLPSFRPDLEMLDEEGIRHDVRHAIAQGFSGTMPMINWTPPGDPRWAQFHDIVLSEAAGRLPLHGLVPGTNPERDIALIRRLEKMGADLIFLAPTHGENISEEELYHSYRQRVIATGLPVMLYAAQGKGRSFEGLGPGGIPIGVFDRLADLPNVVAIKVSQPVSLTNTVEICKAVADRISVGPVNLDFVPLLARHYHMQWSGQWNGEAVQTPAHQYGNELLAACAAHDFVRAEQVMLDMQPALDHFFAIQADVIRKGTHPWQHNKFYSWIGGGNGGLLPVEPRGGGVTVPTLDEAEREQIRSAFRAARLRPSDSPLESFATGRAAYGEGVRLTDLAATPSFSMTKPG